jgi:hypothetical protein
MKIIKIKEGNGTICDVVMLPADVSKRYNCTEGLIVKCIQSWTPIGEEEIQEGVFSLSRNHSEGVLKLYQPQHLYVLSDETPKIGEWCLSIGSVYYSDISIAEHNPHIVLYTGEELGVRKIIASTNNTLAHPVCCISRQGVTKANQGCRERNRCPFPGLSESFKNIFVEGLNKHTTIEKILVGIE